MTFEEARALVISLAFDRADIEDILEASAGQDAQDATAYRPYIVAAFLWWSSRNTQRLTQARGAGFEVPATAIEDLCAMQAPLDVNLTIPAQWTVSSMLNRIRRRAVPMSGFVKSEAVW